MGSSSGDKAAAQQVRHSHHLNKFDLARVEKFFRNRYGGRIAGTAAGLWAMEIKFVDEEQPYILENRRGVPKAWRSLPDAIAFVQAHCPNAAEVLVDVRGWWLMKLAEPGGTL
jgi:hypothetical protein